MAVVEARFYVSGYEVNSYNADMVTVKMQAVSRGEHNKSWARYTPSASVTMTIANPSAASWFTERLGKEIAVIFTEAPEGE